jgi:uncharacterized repeat protein (TIGR03803 family)
MPRIIMCAAAGALIFLAAGEASAQKPTTIASFPILVSPSSLIAKGGVVYGITNGLGMVFQVTRANGLVPLSLHDFAGTAMGDGASPSSLIMDSSGTLYGTTTAGGGPAGSNGAGGFFSLTPNGVGGWNYGGFNAFGPVPGTFPPPPPGTPIAVEGLGPVALVAAPSSPGTFYFISPTLLPAQQFPAPPPTTTIFGQIMQVTLKQPSSPTTVHFFTQGNDCFGKLDGQNPNSLVIASNSGTLYGTTSTGGAFGNGTIFSVTPGPGCNEKVIYNFNLSDAIGGQLGGGQLGTLIIDNNSGALYGIAFTTSSITGAGYGTIFKLTPPSASGGQWTPSVIKTFNNASDGFLPNSLIIDNSSGVLYGATEVGGANNEFGTIFSLTQESEGTPEIWTYNVLYSFTSSDGTTQFNRAFAAAIDNGILYGIIPPNPVMNTQPATIFTFPIATLTVDMLQRIPDTLTSPIDTNPVWDALKNAGVKNIVVDARSCFSGPTNPTGVIEVGNELSAAQRLGFGTAAYMFLRYGPQFRSGADQVNETITMGIDKAFPSVKFIAVDVENTAGGVDQNGNPADCGLGKVLSLKLRDQESRIRRIFSAVTKIQNLGKIAVIYASGDGWQAMTGCNDPAKFNKKIKAMCTTLLNLDLWDTEFTHNPVGNKDCGDGIVGLEPFIVYFPDGTVSPNGYPNGWKTRSGNQFDKGPNCSGDSTTFEVLNGDGKTFQPLSVDWDFFDPRLFQ